MFDQLTQSEIEQYTNQSIENIKQNKDISSSMAFLEEQYSGTYLSVLEKPKFKIKSDDAWEYINNKKVVIYECANNYNKEKCPFINYLYLYGFWRLSEITNNFYKNDLINNAKVIDQYRKRNENDNNIFLNDKESPTTKQEEYLERDCEKTIRDYFDNNYKGEVILMRLCHNMKFIDIAKELTKKGRKMVSKQRIEQICKKYMGEIKEILKKDIRKTT